MQTLYPYNPQILAELDFEELIPDLVKALTTKDFELQELNLEVQDDQEACTYHYKLWVRELSLTRVDPILKVIINFWDLNRLDDEITKITLDYTQNNLYISWKHYC